MMKSILLATIALVMMGGSAQTQTLTSSGPITVTTAGTVIENLRITANGQRCITVNNAPDVILRNIECRHVNEAGVKAFNADRLQITNFNSIHTGTASPNPSSGEIGIYVESSDDVAITRYRTRGDSSGVLFYQSHRARVTFIEGYNHRGPFPRGGLVQFDNSPNGTVEDFSSINDQNISASWTGDIINFYQSPGGTVRRGLLDGSNDPLSCGINFEVNSDNGLVEDLDTIRQTSGSFCAHDQTDNITFRRTRDINHSCQDFGRGPVSGGGQIWSAFDAVTGIRIENGVYWNWCNGVYFLPGTSPENIDIAEAQFTPRAPIVLQFPWEGPPEDTMPPSVPQGLTATVVSNSQINLSWQASTDDVGVVQYDVLRPTTEVASVTGTSYSDTGLAPGTYQYRVRAEDAAGNQSAPSAQAVATIDPDEPSPVGSADIRVVAANGDAEFSTSGVLRTGDVSDLTMVLQGSTRQQICLRFRSLPVPIGATITLATVQFTADTSSASNVSSGTGNLLFRAIDQNDTGQCVSGAASRPRTSAAVAWSSVPTWISGAKTAAQLTPNLAPVVQEVMDRIGRQPGHDLAFWVTSSSNIRRDAESFNGNSAKAAVLHIEWE
jgi:Right handed beta helix region